MIPRVIITVQNPRFTTNGNSQIVVQLTEDLFVGVGVLHKEETFFWVDCSPYITSGYMFNCKEEVVAKFSDPAILTQIKERNGIPC